MNQCLKDKFGCIWSLNSEFTYLNHGSFGARPIEILEAQQALRMQLEASPVDFLDRSFSHLLDEARNCLGEFLNADAAGIGFISNATTGVSAVIHSILLSESDEILTTNQVYNGVRQLLKKRAIDANCSYRELEITFPINSPSEITAFIEAGIHEQTKVLVIDHVTSSTAIIFPIKEIIQLCKNKGILVLVDGAHAPGMIHLNINSLQPDWYVGNLHKWMCAPLGTAFIWTKDKHRSQTHPLTVSHFLGQGYTNEFDWQGTCDITSWLTVPYVIKWLNNFPWDAMMEHNHALAVQVQKEWSQVFEVEPLTPLDGSLIGTMMTLKLPENAPKDEEGCKALRDTVFKAKKVEIPIFQLHNVAMVRFSGQVYVSDRMAKKALFAIMEQITQY